MRATVDSVISQLASLEAVVNNTADSTGTVTLNVEQNDILQQALKNSGLPNKNEVPSKGNRFSHIRHFYEMKYYNIYIIIYTTDCENCNTAIIIPSWCCNFHKQQYNMKYSNIIISNSFFACNRNHRAEKDGFFANNVCHIVG